LRKSTPPVCPLCDGSTRPILHASSCRPWTNNPYPSPDVQQSVLLVLAQAIPTKSVQYALASSSAFAAEMASSLAAGNTPTWYQALPSDVKSLLPQIYPQEVVATSTPTPSSSSAYFYSSAYYAVSSSAVLESPSSEVKVTPYPTGTKNSTVVAPTLSATGSVVILSPSGSSSTTPESPAFTGAASKFTVGAGLGAAIGFLAMLAL
jgi:hypothetical protein